MKMEGLPLHLCHSQHFSLPPLNLLRFLFLFFSIFKPCLASLPQACPQPFECDHKVNMPLLNISGYQYYILKPFGHQEEFPINSMRIVDRNMWGDDCNPSSSNHTIEFWSSPQVRITAEYMNISLWRDCREEDLPTEAYALECNNSWYYSDVSLDTYCKSSVQLPVKKLHRDNRPLLEKIKDGFRVIWNFTEACKHCEPQKENCILDTKNLMKLSCESFNPDNAGGSNTANKTAIALVTAIVGSVLLIVALLLVIAYRKKMFFFNQEVPGRKHDNQRSISKVETFLNNYVGEMQTRYSYSSLKKITNNFAHKLGEGGFGVVYKGKLPSGTLVAVKMLDQLRQSETQFMNEVATIGRIHHFHLVHLLGYCFEGVTSALVYKYMANGSLEKFVLAGKEKNQVLNWNQLYSIALGAARVVAYLHNECHKRIIHFDIKPHNILLDEEFTAKVADFGLAKLCGRKDDHVSVTAARGTPGYVAPELWSRNLGPVTDKSDVYSFGMMLLEMVGGRNNVDVQVSRSSQFYFPDRAFKLIENGELRTRLRERELSGADEVKARSLAKVGLWCIQYNSMDRPSMMRVLQMLEGDADDISNPPTPFISRPPAAPFLASEESSTIEIETAS